MSLKFSFYDKTFLKRENSLKVEILFPRHINLKDNALVVVRRNCVVMYQYENLPTINLESITR